MLNNIKYLTQDLKTLLQALSQNVLSLTMAVSATIVLIMIIRPIAEKFSLVDRPNLRKLHAHDTPVIGGICIFLACIISWMLSGAVMDSTLNSYFIGGFLFLLLGIVDDLFDIRAIKKLVSQIFIASALIFCTNLQITSLGNLFGLDHAIVPGVFSFPLTLICVVGLTNALNMIDGCDGLAGSLALLAVFASLFLGIDAFTNAIKAFLLSLIVSLSVFLFCNISNNKNIKVFLGDGGSLFLGFVVSITLIKFAEGNSNYAPSIVLWLVVIPVFDLSAVIARRLLLGRRVMSSDRSHIHHWLLSFGLSHCKVTFCILGSAFTLLCLGIFIEEKYPSLSLPTFIGLLVVYTCIRVFNSKRDW